MGWIISILLGLLAIAVFCILMDLITLVYEFAWVIPAVIAGIFLIRFIVRPDFRGKVCSLILGKRQRAHIPDKESDASIQQYVDAQSVINDLIDMAMMDGVLSERERRAVVIKAAEMGIEPDEAEVMIDSRLAELAK